MQLFFLDCFKIWQWLWIRLWILKFENLYATCDITVMRDESAVGLVETN